MDYKVVLVKGCFELEKQVKELISQGWEPIGGIAISEVGVYAQAMIKRLR